MSKTTLTRDQYDELEILYGDVRAYSGRGMYGAECLGYTGDNIGEFVMDLAFMTLYDDWDQKPDVDNMVDFNELRPAVGKLFRAARTDSMGRGTIWYWPSIQIEGTQQEATR